MGLVGDNGFASGEKSLAEIDASAVEIAGGGGGGEVEDIVVDAAVDKWMNRFLCSEFRCALSRWMRHGDVVVP